MYTYRLIISIPKLAIHLICFLYLSVTSETICSQIPAPNTYHKLGHTEIPFEYINGFMVVDVLFQRVIPMKFIFDTGAENSVLFKKEIATAFQLPCSRKVRLIGADLNMEILADICSDVYLQISTLPIEPNHIIVLEDDYFFLDEFIGIEIDGILGAEYFYKKVVKIDYKKMIITIIDPTFFKASKYSKYEQFDLKIIDKKPYLNCLTSFNPDSSVNTRMLLDTGAGVSAIFHFNRDTSAIQKKEWVKGILGKGLNGDIEGYIGKVHAFQFGPYTFEQMPFSFQWLDEMILKNEKIVRYGLIGNLMLERFEVIIDYPGKKLYLKALKKYNKPFDYDKSGLTIYAYGKNLNQYYIKYVLNNSPAAISDLQENDIILAINGWSYKWYSLKKIDKILSGKAGKKVKLKIKRGQDILIKQIILKDMF